MLDDRTTVLKGLPSQIDEPCSISDMARIYGVSLRTLRFYEDRGLLSPQRQGTARFYDPANRVRLEFILKGKRLGFTLSEIQALIARHAKTNRHADASGSRSDLMSSLNRDQIEGQILHLERQRVELEEALCELRAALSPLKVEKIA